MNEDWEAVMEANLDGVHYDQMHEKYTDFKKN